MMSYLKSEMITLNAYANLKKTIKFQKLKKQAKVCILVSLFYRTQ
ncbi:hypothetical protein VCHA57P527_160075 [Vibrio chagasii]|nr:hypothetical protein VCHA57P527_160075 [Vibrio chagasii]